MNNNFDITLPLALGIEALKYNNQQNSSSADLQLKIIIKTKALKSIIQAEANKSLEVTQTIYQKQTVVLHCNQNESNHQLQTIIPIYQQNSSKIIPYDCFPFSITIKQQHSCFALQYTKQIINFGFIPVPKAKFVKNQQLSAVMTEQQHSWGLLSMDKSHRIILQPQKTNFPIIGVWSNSSHNLTSSQTMQLLNNYLQKYYSNKCKFTHHKKVHIYLVKINKQRHIPELYIVEYSTGEEITKLVLIESNDIDKQQEIVVQSGEKSSLQFTLRSDEKVPDKLMNISCSPIKFKDYPPFLQDSDKYKEPESPRFKIDNGKLLEQECNSLKLLVRQQAIFINELKTELLRLNSEINAQRKHNNCCCSDSAISSHLSTSKDQICTARPKKLTQSDLNVHSISNHKSQLHPQTSCSSGSQKQAEQDEVWNRFEMQQGR